MVVKGQGADEFVKDVFKSLPQEYVVVEVGGQRYAFEREYVSYVLDELKLSRVPASPPFLAGMGFHTGTVIPVVDMKVIFGSEKGVSRNEKRKILVIGADGLRAGVMVDGVPEIAEVSGEAVREIEGENKEFVLCFLKYGDEHIPCVDVRALLQYFKERMK